MCDSPLNFQNNSPKAPGACESSKGLTYNLITSKNGHRNPFNSKFYTSSRFLQIQRAEARCEFRRYAAAGPHFDAWVFEDNWECIGENQYLPIYGVPPAPLLEPQFGVADILASKGVDLTDSVLSWSEDFIALYASLRDCRTVSQFIAISTLFIKSHMTGSIVKPTLDYLASIISDMEPQDSSEPTWLILFRSLKTNWDNIVRCEAFSKISKLISMAVSVGLCKLSDVQFSVAGVRAFSISVKDKHATAADFFTCVLDTVSFFLEGGIQCFRQGSLKPLMLGDPALAQYEDDFALCLECFELSKAGNLEKYKELSENDFEKLLTDTLATCDLYCKAAHAGTEKNLLLKQREKLLMCATQFRQTRLEGGLRIAPYAIGVFGSSGVGKTSVAQILMTTTLESNGYNAQDDRVTTLNEADKFMSNYRSYINGIYIDDLGNTKADFVDKSPAQKIIEIVNNVHAYANMAEADLKGKVAIEPKVVLITRNIKDQFAHDYSNEPASILRRERVTLTVRVRDKFATNKMLDPEKVAAFYEGNIPVIPDLWEIDVERAFPAPNPTVGAHDTIGWEYLTMGGKKMQGVSIEDVIRYTHTDSLQHFSNQRTLVDQMKDISGKMAVCKECKFPAQMCKCKLEPHTDSVFELLPEIESEMSLESSDEAQPDYQLHEDSPIPVDKGYWRMQDESDVRVVPEQSPYQLRLSNARQRMKTVATSCIDDVTAETAVLYRNLRELDNSWISVINCMPAWMLDTFVGKAYIEWHNYPLYCDHFRSVCQQTVTLSSLFLILMLWSPRFAIGIFCTLVRAFHLITSYRQYLMERLVASRGTVPLIFKDFRDNQVKYLTRTCVAMAGVYAMVKAYRLFKSVTPQGNLSPTSMADIEERDAEQNPWLGVSVTPMHVTEQSKCITHSHLIHLTQNNLCHMSYQDGSKRVMCDAFFPCSNVALVPSHIWRKPELEVTFSRKGNKVIGGHFKALLSKSFSVNIPRTDLCLTWVPNGGSWKNMINYFPEGAPNSCPASVLYKSEDGVVQSSRTRVYPGLVRAVHMSYTGLNYTLDRETFKGLCMAPIVSETKAPAIIGFHLAGKTGTRTGAGGTLTRQQLMTAFQTLSELEGVVLTKNQGTIPTERYDCQFYESDHVHAKSPVRYLPKGANIEFLGSVKGRATYHSEVVETPISQSVEEICGVPNKWGKPQFHSWKPWQVSLAHSCKPSPGMPGNLLSVAVIDFKSGFLEKLRTVPMLLRQTRPLSRMDTICGIDGRRFVDRMPGRTSMGYPLGGPKNDHMTLLDPAEFPTHACPTSLDEKFWDEAIKVEQLFLNGERAYPIFKGCLKDEPTPVHKDKVRVFQSAPIELQLLIRKYFLPVARLLSVFPLVSECAVGINAQGPEWEAFTQHINKFGVDRIFAGDYSKYDLRMPAQLVLAAFRILIDIARECGYTAEQVSIMEGIATEVAYPLMAYNGDLIQLFGSNPSGQNLTVFINGLVNSLLVRCYLGSMDLIPKHKARDLISFLTYGDDIKGSVKSGFPISIKGYAEFLSQYDMVFTMPDKDSELVDLMHDDDADFLKRKNAYVPEINMHLGALDENSIFKSLHSVLRSSSVSLREQSMMNIDGALREWFAHGRDVYERRREQMQQIAELHELAHGCEGLHLTYNDRIQVFCEKYNISHE